MGRRWRLWEDKEGKSNDQIESSSVDSISANVEKEGKGWAQNDSFISLIENKHGFLHILYSLTFEKKIIIIINGIPRHSLIKK